MNQPIPIRSAPKPELTLLSLPYEIREQIYRFALPHLITDGTRFDPRDSQKKKNESYKYFDQTVTVRYYHISTPLFPCKRIYNEVCRRTRAKVVEVEVSLNNEKLTRIMQPQLLMPKAWVGLVIDFLFSLCVLWQDTTICAIRLYPKQQLQRTQVLELQHWIAVRFRSYVSSNGFAQRYFDTLFLRWVANDPFYWSIEYKGATRDYFEIRRTYRDDWNRIPISDGLALQVIRYR